MGPVRRCEARGARREVNRKIQAATCPPAPPPCLRASIGPPVKSVRHRDRQISKDLRADPGHAKPQTWRRARGTAVRGYAAGTGTIARNPFRGNNYPCQCHTTPTGVEKQWRATRCRTSPEKSLQRKDLRPDRQHADEQRERRQRCSFFDHSPDHDPFLPDWTERERCSIFVLKSRAGQWVTDPVPKGDHEFKSRAKPL